MDKPDPDCGPSKYSPNKDYVLIENPKWSWPGRYPTNPEIFPGQDGGRTDIVIRSAALGGKFSNEQSVSPERPSKGPGDYDCEKALDGTRYKSPSAIMKGRDERPRDTSNDNIGPGTYGDQQSKFGEGIPTFTMTKEGLSPATPNNPAPGAYDPSAADTQTKVRNPSALIMGGRPNTRGEGWLPNESDNVGPGAYGGVDPNIAKGVKSMTIG